MGVGYLRLGQSLSTLSGGEAQRLKLAAELTKTGNTYPHGRTKHRAHPLDIDRLLAVIDRLIKVGKNGGAVIATGTPETIATHRESYTGRYLKSWLDTAWHRQHNAPSGGLLSAASCSRTGQTNGCNAEARPEVDRSG